MTLAYRQGPLDAAIATAHARGFFNRRGIHVSVLTPFSPMRPIRYVVEGNDDIGVAAQPQVALAKEKGAPIVAVGSVLARPAATMIWLRGPKIRRIADLRGKTIAIPGLQFQRDLLDAILRRAGVAPAEVKIVTGRYELASRLVSGQVDAIFGGFKSVEGVELETRGLDPVVIPVTRLGVPSYEEMLWVARTDFASRYPQVIRKFLAAVRQGRAAALAHPAVAARIVERSTESNPQLGREKVEAGLKMAAPLFSRRGYMSREKARRLLNWMQAQGFIARMSVSTLQTNRYLPRAAKP